MVTESCLIKQNSLIDLSIERISSMGDFNAALVVILHYLIYHYLIVAGSIYKLVINTSSGSECHIKCDK